MLTYVGRRLLLSLPVVVLSTVVVFELVHLLPGDPAEVLAGAGAPAAVVDAIRHEFGLDQPLPVQYWVWLTHVLHGDLGDSVRTHTPVVDSVAARAPATVELAVAAIVLTILIAVPLGVLAAARRGRGTDWAISVLSGVALSVPGFWWGILAILLFALALRVLPAGGFVEFTRNPLENLRALLLPALTLALPAAAGLSRLVRASMLDVLGEDYVRTARAKGLAGSAVITRHGLRNALVPVATVLGLQLGRLLGGAVITESVFSWPGLGRLLIDSIGYRDYAVVQGTLLLFVVAFILVNLLTDVAYAILDPRIRLMRGAS